MNLSFFSIRSYTFGDIVYSGNIPEHLNTYLLPEADAIVGYCTSGYFLFQTIKGEDYTAWHTTILLNRDDQFIISVTKPILALHFFLEHSIQIATLPLKEQLTFNNGEYNMSFLSPSDFNVSLRKDHICKCLTVVYSEDRLLKIGAEYPAINKLFGQSSLTKFSHLHPNNKLIMEDIKLTIYDFLLCPCKSGETRKVIQRGKIWELLIEVLDQANKYPAITGSALSQPDADKIYTAKEYLDQHHDTPVTLFELSRKVGMNVHKLSSGFLQITGRTIFCYHRQIRMSKAMQLLKETDRDLFDIGTEVGYADGKCFSKEFKKEKGVSPIEYRRKIRAQHQ